MAKTDAANAEGAGEAGKGQLLCKKNDTPKNI